MKKRKQSSVNTKKKKRTNVNVKKMCISIHIDLCFFNEEPVKMVIFGQNGEFFAYFNEIENGFALNLHFLHKTKKKLIINN